MPRIGFDHAFDTISGVTGVIVEGNISIYTDGTTSFAVAFVNAGGDLVPATGDIYFVALLIGNRDPVTGDFTPDAGTPTAGLISDNKRLDNPIWIGNDDLAWMGNDGKWFPFSDG